MGKKPPNDAVLTTCASSCARSVGRKAVSPLITPQRLTPRTQSQWSRVSVSTRAKPPTPALLHSTWTAPNRSSAASRSPATASGSATSVGTASTSPPPSSSSFSACPSASSCTSARTTCIPAATKASAMPRPMPLAAPVTTATRPRTCSIAGAPSFSARPGASVIETYAICNRGVCGEPRLCAFGGFAAEGQTTLCLRSWRLRRRAAGPQHVRRAPRAGCVSPVRAGRRACAATRRTPPAGPWRSAGTTARRGRRTTGPSSRSPVRGCG